MTISLGADEIRTGRLSAANRRQKPCALHYWRYSSGTKRYAVIPERIAIAEWVIQHIYVLRRLSRREPSERVFTEESPDRRIVIPRPQEPQRSEERRVGKE